MRYVCACCRTQKVSRVQTKRHQREAVQGQIFSHLSLVGKITSEIRRGTYNKVFTIELLRRSASCSSCCMGNFGGEGESQIGEHNAPHGRVRQSLHTTRNGKDARAHRATATITPCVHQKHGHSALVPAWVCDATRDGCSAACKGGAVLRAGLRLARLRVVDEGGVVRYDGAVCTVVRI